MLIGFLSLIEPGSVTQLMVAVIISLLFLVLHLQSYPYRRHMDNILATMVNLMLCVFFIWCLLLQTGAMGDLESGRLSSTGMAVSIMMLISVVGVIVVAITLFVLELAAKTSTDLAEKRQREKWAGATIEPPTTKWPADKSYACFLSHYKLEAASDARLLHDLLAKMLRYPVFLDSANLTDLRQLITNGVNDSDVFLVLATKGYITRPWCLLEIVHATRLNTPVLLIDIKNGGFDAKEMKKYVDNIEEMMGAENPDGLELLREHLGQDLSELQEACTRMLDPFLSPDGWSGTKLVWNPNASDTELIACLKDVIDAMGAAMGSTLKWKGTVVSKGDESLSISSRRSSMFSLVSRRKPAAQASALHLICCTDDVLNEARVLQTELAMGLDRLVSTSAPERQRKRINGGVRPAIARGGTGSLQHDVDVAVQNAVSMRLEHMGRAPLCIVAEPTAVLPQLSHGRPAFARTRWLCCSPRIYCTSRRCCWKSMRRCGRARPRCQSVWSDAATTTRRPSTTSAT